VAFAAFAAARHAAAWLLLTADLSAVQQSIDISWPPGPQQQTRSSRLRRPDWTDGQRDGRTDGRTDARQLHKPRSAYYAGCAKTAVANMA